MGLFSEKDATADATQYPSYRLPTTNATLVMPNGRIIVSPDSVFTPSDDEANAFMQECVRVGNAFVERGQQLTPQQTLIPQTALVV